MGYICLGNNTLCKQDIRPTAYDIVVGLNYRLDSARNGSGQIYYRTLSLDSNEYKLTKIYLNLLNPAFTPENMFMITYDEVLSYDKYSNSRVSFQVFLLADSIKSYVLFKFNKCPPDLTLRSSSGLNYRNKVTESLKEIPIDNGQQCTSSNVGQTGIWVIEVTNLASGKLL